MIGRSAPRLVVPALTLALLLALTGCGKPGAQPGIGSIGSTPLNSPTASTAAAGGAGTDSAVDTATLDGITQDLDSADAANGEAGSNAAAGDQAGATGDEK
jgi:hypothetical protein